MCDFCLKHWPMCAFNALAKKQKVVLKDYLEDFTCDCGFPLHPQFDIAQTELNFGNNTVEISDKITCND